MPVTRFLPPLAVWLALWAFWTLATRAYHPDLRLASLATACLVAASAAAVHLDARLLVPRYLRARRPAAYAVALAAILLACGLLAAATIHLLYDALLGPDPRRFSFAVNVALDTAFVALHVAAARLVRAIGNM